MQTKHHLLKLFSTIAILAMMLLNVRPSIAAQIMAHPESAEIPIDLSYPADPLSDIPWSQGTSGVADIQSAFNNARDSENTQLCKSIPMLTLPNQSEWNAISNGEKVLWLINRERIDRGVAPLQGLESNVNGVAQYYADYLLSHNAWGHTEDGRTPWERLEDNPEIGACHDFLSVAENLAVFEPASELLDDLRS